MVCRRNKLGVVGMGSEIYFWGCAGGVGLAGWRGSKFGSGMGGGVKKFTFFWAVRKVDGGIGGSDRPDWAGRMSSRK